MDIRKLGIVGCGNVGATIAYTAVQSRLFSEIVLLDRNEERAMGEVLDISHCLPFVGPMSVYRGTYEKLSDAGIIVVAAGANQSKDETRLDLTVRNARIVADVVERIASVNRECIILIVTNPVDVLTFRACKSAGFADGKVIGSGTVLDTGRMKYLVGERLKVDHRNVHTFIIGEHGDSELAVWSSANISGIDLKDYLSMCGVDFGEIYSLYDNVVKSAYEIIRGKGATYYAIAQAAMRILRSIVLDENSILPVSTLVNGHYGIDGICMSIPCIIGRCGVRRVLDIPLNEDESRRLCMSAETLKQATELCLKTPV